ncbi:formylglycine-generating enzyme family protein [Enterococcus sp. LJL120]
MQVIHIPGGSYTIGTDSADGFPTDNEGPKKSIELASFWIDETTVTNRSYEDFVSATGYVTEAERFGWSFVFHYFLSEANKKSSQKVSDLNWWYAVPEANWRQPEGIGSNILNRSDHPVVQVSRNDAIAYCLWAKKKLPNEAQWEVAAKGGTTYERYPWGVDFLQNGEHQCNIWQGNFPHQNTQKDGFLNTAPARFFEPNGYGLYQMIGNVWEWCANPARIPLVRFEKEDNCIWQDHLGVDDRIYAIRGGSFLCHESYCKRYRIAARNGNSGMSASNNLGFRCVN